MQEVEVFSAKVVDEYGGEYPQAIVSVLRASETSQRTLVSHEGVSPYDEESEIDGIAYSVNYHYTATTKAQGKRSRPLIIEEDGDFTNVLTVNFGTEATAAVMGGNLAHNDKIMAIIRADIAERYK